MAVSAPAASESPTPGAPYREATETIRSTAKWLVAAFAGVGGVLVGGVPVTGLGKVDFRSGGFYVAVVALVVALVPIFWIIPRVARVFTTKYISLEELSLSDLPSSTGRDAYTKVRAEAAEAVDRSRDELYGSEAAHIGELCRRLRINNETIREARARNESPSEQDLEAATALAGAADRVVSFANYEATRGTFRGLYRPMALAGAMVAAAVIVFAFVIGSAPPSPPSVTTPLAVRVVFFRTSAFAKRARPSCDLRKVDAVAVAGRLRSPEVVTTGRDGCPVARVRVTQRTGIAVPLTPTTTR